MTPPMTYLQHARALLTLGLPLIGSNLAWVAIGMTDVAMLGWYSIEAQAAQTVAVSLFFVFFLVGAGFAYGVMPLVASHAEAGEVRALRRVTRMGIWVSLAYGLVMLPVLLSGGRILGAMGQQPELVPLIDAYLSILGWSIFPGLVVMVFRSYLSALERTRVVFWVTMGSVGLNIFLNWVLIFGNLGAPEMGIAGAAIASTAMHCASMVALAFYIRWREPSHRLFQRLWRVDPEALGRVFRLGWPICLTNFAEVSLFAGAAVLMGWLGTVPLAAHGIAMQIASLTFVVHMGLSNAATVRVGRAAGRGDAVGLRTGAAVAVAMSLMMSVVTITTFVSIPGLISSAFVGPNEPERDAVIAAASLLLLFAAMFQTFDGLQVMTLGLLRGLHDATWPMVYAAVGYWCVGMPLSYTLGFPLGYGGAGVWAGLVVALAVVSGMLILRYRNMVRRDWPLQG